jgi:hypothetical protein
MVKISHRAVPRGPREETAVSVICSTQSHAH